VKDLQQQHVTTLTLAFVHCKGRLNRQFSMLELYKEELESLLYAMLVQLHIYRLFISALKL
jgi:hypothetical protein